MTFSLSNDNLNHDHNNIDNHNNMNKNDESNNIHNYNGINNKQQYQE